MARASGPGEGCKETPLTPHPQLRENAFLLSCRIERFPSLGIVPVTAIDEESMPTSPIVDKILTTYYEVVQRETGS